MKFWTNLLLLPVLFGVFNCNKNVSQEKLGRTDNNIAEMQLNAPSIEGLNDIDVKLNEEPYLEKDYFETTFHYSGSAKIIDYWIKEENVSVKCNDRFLKEKGDLEVTVFCYKETGSFTLNIMTEAKRICDLTVYTRLTKFGVFASTGSQTVCDNMALEFEYQKGMINYSELEKHFRDNVVASSYMSGFVPLNKICINAQITWSDPKGTIHPYSGLLFELYDNERDSEGHQIAKYTDYLDENGKCEILIDRNLIVGDSFDFCVYPITKHSSVEVSLLFPLYYKLSIHQQIKPRKVNCIDYCNKNDNLSNRALQIASHLFWAEEFVGLLDSSKIPSVTVLYPRSWNDCHFLRFITLQEYSYFNPDIILHEYGHAIEEKLGLFDIWHANDYGGKHYFSDDYTLSKKKDAALRSMYYESMATVLGFMVQNTFANYFKYLNYAIDGCYSAHGNQPQEVVNIELENVVEDKRKADATELSTTAILYDLYDIDYNEQFDRVGLGNQNFWEILDNYKPKTLNDFINAVYQKQCLNSENLAELLEFHRLTPQNIHQDFGQFTSPTLYWDNSGNTSDSSSKTIGDTYGLKFFDANDQFLFEVNNIKDTKYSLSWSNWKTILNSPGAYYKVSISAKSTKGGYTTGPYFGPKKVFLKSDVNYRDFDVSSLKNCTFGQNIISGCVLGTDNFVSQVFWKDVKMNGEFFCLNASAAADHTSYVEFYTNNTFSSISLDLVFSVNHADKSTTTIEVFTEKDGVYTRVAHLDPNLIPMRPEDSHHSFTISMGSDVNNFRIVVTGYVYTSIWMKNVYFDTSPAPMPFIQDPWY